MGPTKVEERYFKHLIKYIEGDEEFKDMSVKAPGLYNHIKRY